MADIGAQLVGSNRNLGLGPSKRYGKRDEPLLRPVVQVALDPTARVVAGRDDARTRRGELCSAVGVADRGAQELGELLETLLGVGGEPLVHVGYGHEAPLLPLDNNRSA